MAKADVKDTGESGVSYNDIKLLSEIGQQIIATLSVEEIIEKTYKNVNALMDASVFDIGIFNPEENRIDLPGGIEKGERLPFGFYSLKDLHYPAVWCFLNQKVYFTNDYVRNYTDYFPNEAVPEPVAGEQPNAMIYLPLIVQNKRIGVITVQSFKRNAYTQYDTDILQNLAVYVATALENARLYETMEAEVKKRTQEVVAQKEELETSNKNILLLGEIGQQITATLSVEEIIENTYRNVNALMDASVFLIGICDDKKNQLLFPGTMENGEKIDLYFSDLTDKNRPAVWCFKNQREIIMNDLALEYNMYFPNVPVPQPVFGEQAESLIYIPLTIHDKKIGVISVQSFKKNAYTNYHIGIVRNLAVYVSIALENARLYQNMETEVVQRTREVVGQKEELEEKRKEIEESNKNLILLTEIGKEITATLSVEKTIEKVYSSINTLMDANGFGIGVFNKAKNTLDFPGFIENGEKLEFHNYHLEEDDSLSVICFNGRQEIIMSDTRKELTNYLKVVPSPVVGDVTLSLIFLPLISKEKIIGIITVQSFKEDAYTSYHVDLLRNLAIYCAIAIENANIYENINAANEQLAQSSEQLRQSHQNVKLISEIGQKITSTLDLEKILDIVYRNVNSMMDASSFNIGYYNEEKQIIEMKLGMEKGKQLPRADFSMMDKNRLAVWCVDKRKDIFINDYNTEHTNYIEQDLPVIAGEDTASMMFIPLVVEDRVVGIITVQSFERNAYTQYHLEILRTFASYAAVALNNAQAYKQLNLAMQEVEKLSIVASRSENTIVICNPEAEMIWANDSFIRTFGSSLEEFKKERGNTIHDISSNPDIKKVIEECISKKTGIVYESKNMTRNNGERWFQTALSPVFDEDGKLRNIVFIDSDITELKTIEARLKQKNKEVIDSIHYARRIQQALLTSDYYIKKYISDYFILFQPKDIVSGDFYWMLNKDDFMYVVTADCTGHGVPGAFMSMMGINLLNDIIIARNISNPALALDIMREEIINILNPEGAEEEAKDGMDMVLCKFDFKNNKLDFAAANNALYLLRNGVLSEFKGDKMPVGKGSDNTAAFTRQTIELQHGDTIYTFTDGYPDQFGGPKGKKFKYRQLEELLLANANKPMSAQKRDLKRTIEDWKGKLEQVDDVLVIGIKI